MKTLTSKEIAVKYVKGNHNALTDNQEIIDMTSDIDNLIKGEIKDFLEMLEKFPKFSSDPTNEDCMNAIKKQLRDNNYLLDE